MIGLSPKAFYYIAQLLNVSYSEIPPREDCYSSRLPLLLADSCNRFDHCCDSLGPPPPWRRQNPVYWPARRSVPVSSSAALQLILGEITRRSSPRVSTQRRGAYTDHFGFARI